MKHQKNDCGKNLKNQFVIHASILQNMSQENTDVMKMSMVVLIIITALPRITANIVAKFGMKTQKDIKMKMTFDEVCKTVKEERDSQDLKWGDLDEKNQPISGYLLVLESELNEAKEGWTKNISGKHSSLAEIRQVAAVAIACLQQHGIEGN